MQPVEALQEIIAAAEKRGLVAPTQEERDRLAQADQICRSFLDAVAPAPIARFHCYVTVEGIGPKSKLGLGDFTVSGLTIPSIKNGLIGLSMEKVSVYVRLWERHQQGSEMLSGYQGQTKCLQFRNWLADIDRWEAERPQQQIEVGRGPQG